MSLGKGLSILFIFSKNQFLVSLIFSDFKLVSISFTFALIFIMSFFLLIEFFFFSFFYFIRCEVKLFEIFFFVLSFCLCICLCLPLVAACGLFLQCEGPCLAVARGLRVHRLPGVVCA